MTAATFQACYTDWRLIKGRKVVQIVLEIPIEQSDLAYQALNGMPDPGESVWVAVARLNSERTVVQHSDVARRHANPDNAPPASENLNSPVRAKVAPDKRLAAQAGILCDDIRFQRFLREIGWVDCDPADVVRHICKVESRSEIVPGTPAGKEFDKLLADFDVWKAA